MKNRRRRQAWAGYKRRSGQRRRAAQFNEKRAGGERRSFIKERGWSEKRY
jgi:hypothetical protein